MYQQQLLIMLYGVAIGIFLSVCVYAIHTDRKKEVSKPGMLPELTEHENEIVRIILDKIHCEHYFTRKYISSEIDELLKEIKKNK